MAASSCCYSLTPGRILDFYNLQKKFYYFDHTECNMIRNQVDRLNRSNTCNTNLLSRSSGKVTHVIKVLQTQTTSLGAQKQDTYASTIDCVSSFIFIFTYQKIQDTYVATIGCVCSLVVTYQQIQTKDTYASTICCISFLVVTYQQIQKQETYVSNIGCVSFLVVTYQQKFDNVHQSHR